MMASRIKVLVVVTSIVLATILLLSVTGAGNAIVHRTQIASTLIATFFLFNSSDNVRQVTVAERKDESASVPHSSMPIHIPKHIHQVKLGKLDMRPSWSKARQSCMEVHPTWQFTLWEDEQANAFVETNFPQLYRAYRAYPYEIQRSNILRYLLLDHFGGVYLDLDLRCRVALDDVLQNETFLTPPANPSGVNNAFIASVSHHPFWQHLEDNILSYNLAWFRSPYISNMMSTGCHFFSTMHRTFRASTKHSLGVLDQNNKLNGHVVTPLFEHLGASSWHKGDAKAILRLGQMVETVKKHLILVSIATISPILLLSLVVVHSLRRRRMNREDVEMRKGLLEDIRNEYR